ncbi:MAG: TIGR04282 family arsenosugar biosynthesis glycosyltransferase [Proteobacteria bacterium]|nr:TIGR04282 family arsenosugar biosynthesis glycosyltransferase [Pseudomonadota bacterium]
MTHDVDTDRGVIVVFAKVPRPGFVKTRMCPALSPEQAALLYAHLLDDVLATTASAARSLGLDAVLTVHPADGCVELAPHAPADFRIVAQRGRSLGERMQHATLEAAAAGYTRVLLRGSDSPVLGRRQLAAAVDALDEHDLVVCPDRDGGYSLIGLREPTRGLFDHPMSTRSVLEDTLANARAAGLRTHSLATSFDLDTVEDLRRLAAARERGDADSCPRLLDYLDEQRLWPHTSA